MQAILVNKVVINLPGPPNSLTGQPQMQVQTYETNDKQSVFVIPGHMMMVKTMAEDGTVVHYEKLLQNLPFGWEYTMPSQQVPE